MRMSRMVRDQLFAQLIRRTWTPEERDLVRRGFAGRVLIAIEPLLATLVFAVLTIAPFFLPGANREYAVEIVKPQFSLPQVLAPIMALGCVGFAGYTIALMYRPLRALLSTHEPIYIVDGYLRYESASLRRGHRHTMVAVVTHEGRQIQAWHAPHVLDVVDGSYPALIEFSRYGGILRIDGRAVDPPLFVLAPFGIGSFTSAEPRRRDG